MLRSGEVFAGFVIDRLLGRSGMGSVYLARHPRLPRLIALKLLNPELFSEWEMRTRFEHEASLIAQLDHPNIVTVYDRGIEGDQLWISMRYIDGFDAASVDVRTLPAEVAVYIVAEVAKALDFAHGRGVLHRDVNSRSDQYSLACSLFRLLTGSAPFDSGSVVTAIEGHMTLPPPRVTEYRPELSTDLDEVLMRALAKLPAERFGSCTEFATAAYRALAPSISGGSR